MLLQFVLDRNVKFSAARFEHNQFGADQVAKRLRCKRAFSHLKHFVHGYRSAVATNVRRLKEWATNGCKTSE
jgi:hypothetical protein